MKLLNYTTSYFAAILLLIITVWASIFYFAMLDEIYDSLDDGLDNEKLLIIQKAAKDSTVLRKSNFDEGSYAIKEVPFVTTKAFKDVYSDTQMYMQNEKDFEPVRMLQTVFSINNRYYNMKVISSMVEEDDLVSELFYALLWLYAGLIISILVLNNFLLQKIWRPFYRLVKDLKKFRLESPEPITMQPTKVEEFRMLDESVQRLLKSNIDAYTSQKHFIENAAHELQTPLAVSLNKLERVVENDRLLQEDMQLITGAIDNLVRLSRLNKSLLLLSKIENHQFTDNETIDLNVLAKNIMNEFQDQIDFKNIRVDIEEHAICQINLNKDLAQVLLLNLIKNAVVHNVNGGFIKILFHQTSLTIENSGSTIPLESEKVFTRFYKEHQSLTSNGLGLAIVKSIADLYGFRVNYQYSNHHIISLQFS